MYVVTYEMSSCVECCLKTAIWFLLILIFYHLDLSVGRLPIENLADCENSPLPFLGRIQEDFGGGVSRCGPRKVVPCRGL